jgi:hypothetical protein
MLSLQGKSMLQRLLAGLALALLCSSVSARIGTIGQGPAATLLFPHFEVDTASDQGVSTVLTVQNSSATAILANVTLWTDYGVPTAHFLIYMTGYDQQTIDLADTFRRRFAPITATAGQDPTNTISPKGVFSQDINFASCTGLLPEPQGSLLDTSLIQAHTGRASVEYLGGQCGGRNYGDGIARGYITMDTVNNCTPRKPGETGYFNPGGSGDATNQNVMLGDYVIVDRPRGRFLAESAVHIEASFFDPLVTTAGNPTFYGRLIGNSAADNREPLPTAWAARYASARTEVDYWRDPGAVVAPFACGTTPAPFPLGQRHVSVFNDAGALLSNPTGTLFPYAMGSTAGAGALGLSQPLGWLFVNLNPSAGVIRQSWMNFRQMPRGVPSNSTMGYSVPGIQLGNAATGADPVIP